MDMTFVFPHAAKSFLEDLERHLIQLSEVLRERGQYAAAAEPLATVEQVVKVRTAVQNLWVHTEIRDLPYWKRAEWPLFPRFGAIGDTLYIQVYGANADDIQEYCVHAIAYDAVLNAAKGLSDTVDEFTLGQINDLSDVAVTVVREALRPFEVFGLVERLNGRGRAMAFRFCDRPTFREKSSSVWGTLARATYERKLTEAEAKERGIPVESAG